MIVNKEDRMRKRQYDMHLRLNEKEHRKLDELASKAGVTRSTVMRKLIMGEKIKERPNVDFFDLRQSIHHLANNVNQIAHHANIQGGITADEAAEAKRIVTEIRKRLYSREDIWG